MLELRGLVGNLDNSRGDGMCKDELRSMGRRILSGQVPVSKLKRPEVLDRPRFSKRVRSARRAAAAVEEEDMGGGAPEEAPEAPVLEEGGGADPVDSPRSMAWWHDPDFWTYDGEYDDEYDEQEEEPQSPLEEAEPASSSGIHRPDPFEGRHCEPSASSGALLFVLFFLCFCWSCA